MVDRHGDWREPELQRTFVHFNDVIASRRRMIFSDNVFILNIVFKY